MAQVLNFTVSVYGSVPVSGQSVTQITGEAALTAGPDIPAAKSSTLTTRTNNTSGTLTMTTGHGYTTGNRCDLYWTNADGTLGKAYGAVLGTVGAAPSDTAVPIVSVAGGDNLPIAATVVIICKCVEVPLAFDGDDMKAIVAQAPSARSYFVMNDGTYNLNPQYILSNGLYYWHEDLSDTNPLVGEAPTRVFISHADTDRTISNSILSVITGD